MARLTREAFLGANRPELPREEVELPAFGGSVFARTMTVSEFDAFLDTHREDPGDNFRVRLAIAGLCDEAGTRLFTADDAPALAGLPSTALEPAIAAVLRLNGMSEAAREDARKNSETGPT